jgi:hypothetical protein
MSSMYGGEIKPMLTEPGVKYFLGKTLQNCSEFKNKYHNFMVNALLGASFFIILGGFLLYKYKGKLTPSEMAQKEADKMQYILSKISNYQMEKKRESQELITGLPHWDNEYEAIRTRVR